MFRPNIFKSEQSLGVNINNSRKLSDRAFLKEKYILLRSCKEKDGMWMGISIVLVLVSLCLFIVYFKYKDRISGLISVVALLISALAFMYSVDSNKGNADGTPNGSDGKPDSAYTETDDSTDIDAGKHIPVPGGGGSSEEDVEDVSDLELYIKEWKLYEDGYHYEEPSENPGQMTIVDFERGIMGEFAYSRELTKGEEESFSHGGQLFDASGHEVDSQGDLPTYFSSLSGTFILELPKELPAGDYTYELRHFIFDRCLTAKIDFTIK